MILIQEGKCDYCGCCVSVCPPDCIDLSEADIVINPETCTNCELCVFVCPIEVLSHVDEQEV